MKWLTVLASASFIWIGLIPISNADGGDNDEYRRKSYVKGCYYTNWSQYRPGAARYFPANYQPGLCTHLYFAFVVMDANFNLKATEWNDQGYSGMYNQVVRLKDKQKDLKVLLSFGGAQFSQNNKTLIQAMVNNEQNRKTFVQSALDFVKVHKFDGLDLDWEYPCATDKSNFGHLIQMMSREFHESGLLLTAAVSAYRKYVDEGYDVQIMAQHLDMINVMSYDYHGPGWNKEVAFNSPLYDFNGDKLSLSDSVEYWHMNGIPKEKIVVGMAAYGRAWILEDKSRSELGSPATSDDGGPFTKEPGFLAYYEICYILQNGGIRRFDQKQKVPYVVQERRWISYDDEESFGYKVDWIKNNSYAGTFVWALDLDDFNAKCTNSHGRQYPLLSSINL